MAPDPVNPTLKSLLPGAFQPNNLQTQQPQISPLTTLRSLSTPVDMGAPAMPQLPPAPMPTLPQAGLRPLVTNPQQQQMQRQMDEYAKMANIHQGLTHSGAPAHGFWQHLAKIAEGAGNVAGDVFAPGVEANIPGSQLYRAQEASAGARGLAGLENQQTAEQQAASREGLEGAQADEAAASAGRDRAQTTALENPAAKPVDLAQAYANAVQTAVAAGRDPVQDPVVGHLADAIQNIQKQPASGTEKPQAVQINGQPGYAVYDQQKGWIDPVSRQPIQGAVRPIPPQPSFAAIYPQVTGGRATDQATEKWQQEAGQYQGTLNTLGQAKTGSELSAALVPLGVAMVTPTAAGVHRINTAEIAQAGPKIGSLGRQLDAALEKAGSGALPPETIREAEQFVKMYQQLKYNDYLAQVKQAADTFRLPPDQTFVTAMDGQTEMTLPEAMKQAAPPSGAGGGEAPDGTQVKMADGSTQVKRGGKWVKE